MIYKGSLLQFMTYKISYFCQINDIQLLLLKGLKVATGDQIVSEILLGIRWGLWAGIQESQFSVMKEVDNLKKFSKTNNTTI